MNISLPDTLKSFVDEQVATRGYGTSSEYVRELIRADQDRQRLKLLLDGASPAAVAIDEPVQGPGIGRANGFGRSLCSRTGWPPTSDAGVVVDAKPEAVGFYEKLGATPHRRLASMHPG